MNTKKLLFLLILSAISFATEFSLNAQANKANICTKKNCGKDKNCLCYCAFKGDYREQIAEDSPQYKNAKDKENLLGVSLCFCAPRDIKHLAELTPEELHKQINNLQAKKPARQARSAAAQEYRQELADVYLEDQDIIDID